MTTGFNVQRWERCGEPTSLQEVAEQPVWVMCLLAPDSNPPSRNNYSCPNRGCKPVLHDLSWKFISLHGFKNTVSNRRWRGKGILLGVRRDWSAHPAAFQRPRSHPSLNSPWVNYCHWLLDPMPTPCFLLRALFNRSFCLGLVSCFCESTLRHTHITHAGARAPTHTHTE